MQWRSKSSIVAAAALAMVGAGAGAGVAATGDSATTTKQAMHSGVLPAGFAGPHRGRPGLDAAATYLGLTQAELRTQLLAGKSLAQVAGDKGKPVDGLEAAILADAKSHLAQAVTDGKLTQAQADQRLAGLTSRIGDLVNRTGPPPGRALPGA